MHGSTSIVWCCWNDFIACVELSAFGSSPSHRGRWRCCFSVLSHAHWFLEKQVLTSWGLQFSSRNFVKSKHIAKLLNALPILMNHGTDRMMSMQVQGARSSSAIMLTQVKTSSMQLKYPCLSYSNGQSSWSAHHQYLDQSQRLNFVGEKDTWFSRGWARCYQIIVSPMTQGAKAVTC